MLLPFLLTASVVGVDRLTRRIEKAALPSGVAPSQVLLLAAIAILTHPILDTLNTYGVRWLMPFSGEWFYGDTLFIVDPWLWLILGAGLALSGARRKVRRASDWTARPAVVALMAAASYVVLMGAGGVLARRIVARELRAATGSEVDALMVGPLPVTPFARQVVASQGDQYRVAEFHWLRRPHVDPGSLRSYSRTRPGDPAVASAVATPAGRRFMSWARFPLIEVEHRPGAATLVHLLDLRYADRPSAGFGAITIAVPAPRLNPT